jgi:hypothetical protein
VELALLAADKIDPANAALSYAQAGLPAGVRTRSLTRTHTE